MYKRQGVDLADALPVRLQVADGLEVEAGGPFGVVGRGDDRRQRRLRGGAGHRRHRPVHRVRTGLDRGEVGGELAARGVVGVDVHRQVELPAQGRHQLRRGRRPQQAGHVLDGQDVRAGVHDPLGQAQVVVEGVELLGRVGQVGGVAQGHFRDGRPGLPYRLDGGPHLVDVVEGVEDAEDVDTGGRRLLHERVGHLGGVRRVAHGVAAAQQHLQADVRRGLPQRRQALPRVLGEEAQRDVVGRAAPALQGQQLGQGAGHHRGDGEHVLGAHPGGEQRLVGVAEGGVGDADGRRGTQLAREALRTEFGEPLPGAGGRIACRERGQLGQRVDQVGPFAVRLVHGDVGQVGEQLRAAVGGVAGGEQVRALLDERRGDPAGLEVRVVQHGLQEGDVGGHAADAELGHGTPGAAHRGVEVPAPAGELHQHRVEVRADLRTGVGGAAVEADARAAR